MKNLSSHIFMFAKKGLSNDDVGAARGTTVFQKIRPGAGFKTVDFVEEILGGATIERARRRKSVTL